VSTYSFRKLSPTIPHKHAIRVPGMMLLAPLGFILATFMLYWSSWPLNGEVILVVLLGVPVYIYYAIKRGEQIKQQLSKCVWIISYLVFVGAFGYFGCKDFGGLGIIPGTFIADHVLLAFFSLIFFAWGVRVSFKTKEYIEEIDNATIA
jgi:hypothetical protein